MKLHETHRALMLAVALTAAGLSGLPSTLAKASPPPTVQAAAECEGAACQQVTLTYDEARGQYRAQNNSTDRWVRVVASNAASAADACLGPGKIGYLQLKSIVGAYRADYSEPRCGAPALPPPA